MDETFERLGKSLEIMGDLGPFLLYRLGVYAIFGGVMLVYWLIAGVICWIMGSLGGVIFLAFALGNVGLVWLARGYLLYMVKAGYVAALTHVVTGCSFPPGVTQTEFAKQAVASRFGDISAMAAFDALIRGVIKAFNRTLEGFASWIPIPGLDQVAALIKSVVSIAAGTVDEAILSLAFLRKEQSVWAAAKDGVLLYAQNWKPILKIAVAVTLIDWICTAVALVVFGLGFAGLAIVLTRADSILRIPMFILPFVCTYVLRLAFFEPLAVTAVLITFHRCIKGQKIDPAWDEKLSAVSSHWETLKQKASEMASPAQGRQPAKA